MTTSTNAITKIIVLIVGLSLAIVMANMLVTDKFSTFLWLAGAALFVTGVSMGREIWMLIPLTASLGLTLMIPGMPTTLLAGQGMFVGFAAMLFLMRRLPWKLRFTELDFWFFLVALCILQVYARNPVGLNLFGGDQVGGRPYVLVAIGYVAYIAFSNMHIPAKKLGWILKLTVIGALVSFSLFVIGFFVPGIGMWYGAAGRGTDSDGGQIEGTESTGVNRATRISFLGRTGMDFSLIIASFRNPLKASFHPIWGVLILISLVFTALSGFRNKIVAVGLTYLVGIAYRGGWVSVILSAVTLATATVVLALTNAITPLPANIQRSLSFLPGTWDESILRDAQHSTDWRMAIWKEVMLSDRWITNKWLGDGLGFSAQELRAQANMSDKAFSMTGLGKHVDAILASGDYHSGPIQTIRTIGYVGLLLVLLAQIRLAVHAHRQIKRCRGTEWLPLALIVGIPLVWNPIFFVFVFGTFASAMEGLLLGAGLVKILEHNLPLPAYQPRAALPPLYRNPHGRAQRQPAEAEA